MNKYRTLFTTVLDLSKENIDGYKEDYAECNDTDIDSVSDSDAIQMMYEDNEVDWEEMIYQIEKYDSYNPYTTYQVECDFGLWDGHHQVKFEKETLKDAIYGCIGNSTQQDIIIKENQFGNLIVEYQHHDGVNTFHIYKLQPRKKNIRFSEALNLWQNGIESILRC